MFVCKQDISKSCGQIPTKLDGQVGGVTRTNRLDFGKYPDEDTIIFEMILHHYEMGPKTIYNKISKNVVDRL